MVALIQAILAMLFPQFFRYHLRHRLGRRLTFDNISYGAADNAFRGRAQGRASAGVLQ